MKTVEEYIEEGVLRKITPDTQRSKSLYSEAKKKRSLLEKKVSALGVDEENANDYVEYCYNILMILIRAVMLSEGYISSGKGAHEAEVCYAKKKGLSDKELALLDQLRYFRNGILYYGKSFDAEYAHSIIAFTHNVYEKLNE